MHQTGFTGTGHACHGDHHAERNFHVNVLQIIGARAEEGKLAFVVDLAAFGAAGNGEFAAQVTAG